jgi:hypothetical protein
MVSSSPGLFAASHVLLRLSVPRHPPCALCNLPYRCSRSLWSSQRSLDASGSVPAGSHAARGPPGTWMASALRRTVSLKAAQRAQSLAGSCGAVTSVDPTQRLERKRSSLVGGSPTRRSHRTEVLNSQWFTEFLDHRRYVRPSGEPRCSRKEVIQPHLPVRLPCYDFVPIAGPTFDGSLPKRVGPPASGVTDFHDVTGGVYKARERIHRSVADLRLLATPTSRSRVADYDPN